MKTWRLGLMRNFLDTLFPFADATITSQISSLLLCFIIRHVSSQLFLPSGSLLHSLFHDFLCRRPLGCDLRGSLLRGRFFGNLLTGVFVAGAFFKTSVTVVTAAPTAVLTAPATSSAIAIPKPTAALAFSIIVFSAILRSLSLCVLHAVVEAYRRTRPNLSLQVVGFSVSGRLVAHPPQCPSNSLRCAAE
jgi:hypothetical protein